MHICSFLCMEMIWQHMKYDADSMLFKFFIYILAYKHTVIKENWRIVKLPVQVILNPRLLNTMYTFCVYSKAL